MTTISNLSTVTQSQITGSLRIPVLISSSTKQVTLLQVGTWLQDAVSVSSVSGDNIGITQTTSTGDVVLSLKSATALSIGGIKVGANLSISGDGVLSAATPYVLLTATNSVLGGVKIGSGVAVTSDGTISVNTGTPYVLLTATNSVLGGVKIGSGIDVTDDGTISTVPMTTASNTVLGGIKIGAGLSIDGDGVVTAGLLDANITGTNILVNANETQDYISSTGTLAGLSGIVIKRGPDILNAAGLFFDDNKYISTDTTSTRGIFHAVLGVSTNGILVNYIRIGTDTSELNIFGTDNADGVISVQGTTAYETNVVHDDHIPNKKYVDALVQTPATTNSLGTIRIGNGLTVDGTGTVSATALPLVTATTVTLGGVKIGSGISVTADGTISASASYTLPQASGVTLGGVKIGAGIGIAGDGTISVTTASFALQTATNMILGGVKIGSGISITEDGTISASAAFTGGTVAGATTFTNTVNVINTLTVQSIAVNGASTPQVYSASNLNLSAVGRVQVTQSPFKVWNVTDSQRDAISAANGDMIYNTDTNKFQGYANGSWVDLN